MFAVLSNVMGYGDLAESRTLNLLLKRELLYQLSYQADEIIWSVRII